MKQCFKYTGVIILLAMAAMQCMAQPYDGKKSSKDSPSVTLRVEVTSPTTAMFVDLQKPAGDNARLGTNQPGKIEVVRDGKVIVSWDKSDSERVWKAHNKSYVPEPEKPQKEQKAENNRQKEGNNAKKETAAGQATSSVPIVSAQSLAPVSSETAISDFDRFLAADAYYADNAITTFKNTIDQHITTLRNAADKDAYIAEHELDSYARAERNELQQHRDDIEALVSKFLSRYKKNGVNDREQCEKRLAEIAGEKLDQREEALSLLENELGITPLTEKTKTVKWVPIALCIAGVLLLIPLLVWLVKRKKTTGPAPVNRNLSSGYNHTKTGADPGIVVRRTTTTVLKPQSIADVINNPAYLPIEVADICDFAAVRRIYLKNTCVKDIYEMYARDLSNSPNPNENGCMVLGRWVYNPQQQVYDVSLEEVVMPGDDAVFQEYELNFGGKIKLRATGRLRKLKAQTNLQYDLTCWVHSHPGLGVFFSNADTSVHHQLKQPTHPHFLTAFVVDILTKGQQMGIFVFKKDGSISSKNDLKRMLSLEKLYQWAVESERNNPQPQAQAAPQAQAQAAPPSQAPVAPQAQVAPQSPAPVMPQPQAPVIPQSQAPVMSQLQAPANSFPPIQPISPINPTHPTQPIPPTQPFPDSPVPPVMDYIDILSHAAARLMDCHSIMMNKQAVMELKQLTDHQEGGLVGFVHGSMSVNNEQTTYTIERICSQPQMQNLQLMGCVVVSPHTSLPSVKKAVAPFIGLLKFVMVYSSADGIVNTIPVLRQELCIDGHFYGEQKLEDLISWVRIK